MDFRRTLRSGVAAACIASVATPTVLAAPPAPVAASQRGKAEVRVAQAATFSRLEIRGLGSVRSAREGQVLRLTFSGGGDPDISRLRTSPPDWIKTAELRRGKQTELLVTLTDDADAKVGAADGAVYVNVFEKAPPKPEAAPLATPLEPEPPRPSPAPASGVVRMENKVVGDQAQLIFTWANPAGAAVFRRGDAIWVVFDAAASLDVSKAPQGLPQFSGVQAYRGADHAAIRIEAAAGTPVFAVSEGNTWTITLGPGDHTPPTRISVSRDADSGPAALKAPVAGATRVVRLADPVVGDEVTVVTALGPAKGIGQRRDYVQLSLLESAQGLAVETLADGLEVTREGDIVHLMRGGSRSLALSPAWAAQERGQAALGSPMPAAMPALIDHVNWPKTGEGGFLARYDRLLAAAGVEAGDTSRDAPTGARMAMARFLVGSELSFEALGVLNDAARAKPALLENAEFRGLRGVARVMARRYKEAQADFSSPVLSEDPSSAMWRAYIAAQLGQWSEARTQFARGVPAFAAFSPVWKARFARGDAQAALEQGDLAAAQTRIALALEDKTPAVEELATRLVQARIVEAQGHPDRALRIYTALATAPAEYISAPATLRATRIKLDRGQITPVQAAGVFDGLRYRWRGDDTELETIRALGQLYLAQGRYREALEALRSAGGRMPDRPESLQLAADLTAAFRSLFLEGMADGLEPVQALALFYDFKEQTPVGADGDLMVRKLVRRLVDVDLLAPAADLLKYQVDNRLDGVPKAQVATDLAVIYLMDRKPEQALQTINNSRTTVLPTALNAERRLIEARAWAGLNRYDSALEIIGRDTSKEGQDLRAEIAWKQKNWAVAAPLLEKALGQRWKDPAPLSSDEEGRLLRTGVAYSLAGDEAALARLSQQYRGFFDQARNPEALRIALTGQASGRLSVADFGRVSADNEAFAGWVSKMKVRFRTPNAARPAPAAKQATAPAAPAPPNKA